VNHFKIVLKNLLIQVHGSDIILKVSFRFRFNKIIWFDSVESPDYEGARHIKPFLSKIL
jgi:hypothetical protein